MVNEIKLGNINTQYIKENLEQKNKSTVNSQSSEDVTVTNQLNDLIKTVNTYDEPIHQSKLNAIKQEIQRNDYQVDFDKLSDKLLSNGIINSIGD